VRTVGRGRTRFRTTPGPSARAALVWQCRLAPERRKPQLLAAGLAGRPVVVIDQGKAAAADQPAPAIETVEAGVTALDEALLVLPSRVGGKRDALGFSAACSRSRTPGKARLGTWNRTALANTPSKLAGGRVMASMSCCQTSQPETARAMATNSGQPSSPTTTWPRSRKATRSRPGPQPRSRMRYGGAPAIAASSVWMFWLTGS
jgi:hypothetical protein